MSPPTSRPSWSLSKNSELLGVFKKQNLAIKRLFLPLSKSVPSSRVCRDEEIWGKCKSVSFIFSCHQNPRFYPRTHLRSASSHLLWTHHGSRNDGSTEGRAQEDGEHECVGNAAGRARGRWTAEFASPSCWGGLRTCCNTAAGQTESGSLWGRPAEGIADGGGGGY